MNKSLCKDLQIKIIGIHMYSLVCVSAEEEIYGSV